MKLRQYLRVSAVVIFTAVAVVTMATQSFAQLPGGGLGHSPNQEKEDGQPVYLHGTYSEARNGGHLLTVWRGFTNDQVWMSLDNGRAFTIGGTITFESPTVAPFGRDSFMVFHTGDSGDIWYTQVFGDGNNSGTWTAVPGNFTNLSVSVAQMGTNSSNLYLVYRGLGNDLRIFGTWYNGQTGNWANAAVISGGAGNSAPGVSMNNATNQLFVTVEGTDGQLWMTHQTLGAKSWNSWVPMGIATTDTPHSVACPNGNMVVSVLDGNEPQYAKFDGWGNRQSNWYLDRSATIGWPIQLAETGNNVFSLATVNLDGAGASTIWVGYWEQIYDCS